MAYERVKPTIYSDARSSECQIWKFFIHSIRFNPNVLARYVYSVTFTEHTHTSASPSEKCRSNIWSRNTFNERSEIHSVREFAVTCGVIMDDRYTRTPKP